MKVLILIFFVLILSYYAEALAVASDYLEDNTLELIEGSSSIYSIRLQNPESYEVAVKVVYDKQHMKGIDFKEEYIIAPKSTARVEFNVTAPKYKKKNNEFSIGYTVHQTSGPSGGGIPFLTKISKNIKLKVVKDPSRLHINYLQLALALALVLFIFFLYKKKSLFK